MYHICSVLQGEYICSVVATYSKCCCKANTYAKLIMSVARRIHM